jgi:two-component system chemotaxis response regulator CheB
MTPAKGPRKAEILVIDDSALARARLREVIEADPMFRVVEAADPYEAVERMKESAPDAIVLDVEMPRMDGLTFLRKLMKQHPRPVILCTDHVQRGLTGLEYGALDVIAKPDWTEASRRSTWASRVREALRQALGSGIGGSIGQREDPLSLSSSSSVSGTLKLTADVMLPRAPYRPAGAPTERLIVIGVSTGGVGAIQRFLPGLREDSPGVVIVQHMPEKFIPAYAERLATLPEVRPHVVLARDKELIRPGVILVAPGDLHAVVRRTGLGYRLELMDGPPVSWFRPSVDVLFRSAAQAAGPRAAGVIMTGMLDDGAAGLLELSEAGALTIAQDEATSTVFGMPGEAIRRGAAQVVLPLDKIAGTLMAWAGV